MRPCPDHWEYVSGKCYYVSKEKVQYSVAVAKCKEYGGRLFEPKDLATNNEIYQLMVQKDAKGWIGIKDVDKNFNWVYESTGNQIGFSNWGEGEPNNKGGDVCTDIWYKSGGKWNNNKCNAYLPFTCELLSCNTGNCD